jgi:DNA-binding NarL/FixJ family response regulator
MTLQQDRQGFLPAWRRRPTETHPTDRRATAVWDYCPLTERQIEVLQHIAEGLTSEQTAETLGVSKSTITHHLQEIRMRLTLGTRISQALLVAIAMREGWIQ